jgi:FixJ family two-component response regulator
MLPDMPGDELGRVLAARYPSLAVILMSGYPFGSDLRDEQGNKMRFLQKPFSISALEQELLSALESRMAGVAETA